MTDTPAGEGRVEEIARLHLNIHPEGVEFSGGCHICELLARLRVVEEERDVAVRQGGEWEQAAHDEVRSALIDLHEWHGRQCGSKKDCKVYKDTATLLATRAERSSSQ